MATHLLGVNKILTPCPLSGRGECRGGALGRQSVCAGPEKKKSSVPGAQLHFGLVGRPSFIL